MNRIPITDDLHKTGIPALEILSVTICPQLIPVEFRIKFCNNRGYKIVALIFPVNYVIINMRAAGPSDKPLISFFQAKKERVKSFFSVSRLSLFVS